MTVRQLDYRCWVVRDPACDRQPHVRDAADAADTLAEIKRDDPDSVASIHQETAPCWVAQCDGDCGECIDEQEDGLLHYATRAETGPDIRALEWAETADGRLFCPDDRPVEARPPLPSPEAQENAGQLSFLA